VSHRISTTYLRVEILSPVRAASLSLTHVQKETKLLASKIWHLGLWGSQLKQRHSKKRGEPNWQRKIQTRTRTDCFLNNLFFLKRCRPLRAIDFLKKNLFGVTKTEWYVQQLIPTHAHTQKYELLHTHNDVLTYTNTRCSLMSLSLYNPSPLNVTYIDWCPNTHIQIVTHTHTDARTYTSTRCSSCLCRSIIRVL